MNATTANASPGGNLTMAILLEAIDKLPPPPKWKAIVLKPQSLARLRAQHRTTSQRNAFESFAGLPFYEKQGQSASAWAFSDDDIMRKYLDGELSECALIQLSTNGVCHQSHIE